MKILIFGAGGIIGQHMMLCKPDGVKATFFRRKPDLIFSGVDITDPVALRACLDSHEPDAVINLAGESSPDVVERDPKIFEAVNMEAPLLLTAWANQTGKHYIQISTQAVLDEVNAYGKQKALADAAVMAGLNWTIARPTFVLGVRPLPHVGRPNPIEQMLGGQQKQVDDRWFSVSFAWDVAEQLWEIAQGQPLKRVVHLGVPVRTNRYEIARALGLEVEGVSHDSFEGIAPRPLDTTYPEDSWRRTSFEGGLAICVEDFRSRKNLDLSQRASEISLFLGMPDHRVADRLRRGFSVLHGDVAADFRRANPVGDAELLEWYRGTEAYIWELSAYHADAGFNYTGMCKGVAERLKAAGARSVLCLGDGIGDLTLSLQREGFGAVYHDLAGSRTADFARFRLETYLGRLPMASVTSSWKPDFIPWKFDAVVSFDFLEHVTDVPAWTAAIRDALKPGGLFFAQNAFACGSGPDGSIPMHLSRNDRFEKDWDPHLGSLGFVQESSNWYRWPGVSEAVCAS